MIEPTTLGKDTYALPASNVEVSSDVSVEKAYADALKYALDTQTINPEDVDQRRVESVGASIITAAETVSPAEVTTIEQWWLDPAFMMQLSRLPVEVRKRALRSAGTTQDDFAKAV